MTNFSSAAAAAGRLLLSAIFILSGFQKLAGFGGTATYMASLNLPLPTVAALIAVVVECGGGLLIAIGYQTRLIASIMALFTIATAFIAHANFADQAQVIQFLKNCAICGGFLQLVAFGAGGWSIDGQTSRKA